ncbi:MAG TPA: DUF2721 domain-containing protein [Candidatus Sulfotelmatobacter sp.]|nr:DUF2721 domain-containing protein [Candidatus Sulfotelmatobacter sp.]
MGIPTEELVRILTAAIAPVIVISGVGLLLLSLTNRFSHITDRARLLVQQVESPRPDSKHEARVAQVRLFYRRARLLRLAITLSAASILFLVLTILTLFAGLLLGLGVHYVTIPLFTLALVSLLGSIFHFIQDVRLSIIALEAEVGPHLQQKG